MEDNREFNTNKVGFTKIDEEGRSLTRNSVTTSAVTKGMTNKEVTRKSRKSSNPQDTTKPQLIRKAKTKIFTRKKEKIEDRGLVPQFPSKKAKNSNNRKIPWTTTTSRPGDMGTTRKMRIMRELPDTISKTETLTRASSKVQDKIIMIGTMTLIGIKPEGDEC